MHDPLLSEIRVVNFRSARQVVLGPGPVCAFIGEPGAGKSNLLFALRALLDPSFHLSSDDVTLGQREISIEATLADGRIVSLDDRTSGPPIAHFPAALRGGDLLRATAGSRVRGRGGGADPRVAGAGARAARGARARARGLRRRRSGVVFAIEEPELFLAPQAHRYLYRLIRRLAERGNQIFFTTHAPGLLSVAALEEVNLVTRDELGVTAVERLGRSTSTTPSASCASSTPSVPSSSSRGRRSWSRG